MQIKFTNDDTKVEVSFDGSKEPTLTEQVVVSTAFKCDQCTTQLSSQDELDSHLMTVHRKIITFVPNLNSNHVCPFCEIVTDTLEALRVHFEKNHTEAQHEELHICSKCSFSGSQTALNSHISEMHTPSNLTCDYCHLVVDNDVLLREHLMNNHSTVKTASTDTIEESCEYCEFKANSKESIREHMVTNHENVVIMHTMAAQVDRMTDDMENFKTVKTEVTDLIHSFREFQNMVKQELFLIRNTQLSLQKASTFPVSSNTASKVSGPSSKPQINNVAICPSPEVLESVDVDTEPNELSPPNEVKQKSPVSRSVSTNIQGRSWEN